MPLGNEMIRELTPLVRSILIAGPHGSGKKMLVNAICTELGAVLFDLTPSNIAGKYPGKSGLIMLLHLISKVILINCIEKHCNSFCFQGIETFTTVGDLYERRGKTIREKDLEN